MNIEITPDQPKPYMCRQVSIQKEFIGEGTWVALRAAETWLIENGYDWGSSCAMKPTAITKGKYADTDLPNKWKNFTPKQEKSVEGVITGETREGPVYVRIFA